MGNGEWGMGNGEWGTRGQGDKEELPITNSQFPIPQLPITNYPFGVRGFAHGGNEHDRAGSPIPNSQFPIPNCQFPIAIPILTSFSVWH
jgi:hypothetical protein